MTYTSFSRSTVERDVGARFIRARSAPAGGLRLRAQRAERARLDADGAVQLHELAASETADAEEA